MEIRRIDLIIFGYRKIEISVLDIGRAASVLLRSGVNSKISSSGIFYVRERDCKKVCSAFEGQIQYSMSEPRGLYGAYLNLKHKWVVFSALFVCVLLILLSGFVVWDVRIEGNETLPDAAIEYVLSEAGLSIGDIWWLIDKNDVERNLLELEPEISWININRRGNVAYVKVAQKRQNDTDNNADISAYANVVAACDCVIEEITVTRGVAMVKKGDVVKKGDLLISGVVTNENGGEICYAQGSVIGRLSDRIMVDVGRESDQKVGKREILVKCDVKIFDFTINIFKRYRNSNIECGIIEDVKVFSLFGKCRLPIKTVSVYEVEYDTESKSYTDNQLVRLAAARLNSATIKRLVGSDLIKIKTCGSFTDFGYSMYSDVEYLSDVGVILPFESK